MKRKDKENITTIIHDIKTSYSKIFKEKFPLEFEPILIEAARKAKKGYEIEWYRDENGSKKIRVF